MNSNSKSTTKLEVPEIHTEEMVNNQTNGPTQETRPGPEPLTDDLIVKLLRLLVGLGGQGKEDLNRLKSLARKPLSGITWPKTRRLEVDNDETGVEEFENDEFLSWNNVPAGDFLLSAQAHPELYSELTRWGDLKKRYKEFNLNNMITAGNGGHRPNGQIVWIYQTEMHGAELETALMTPVDDLLRPSSKDRSGDNNTEGLKIEYKLGVSGSFGNTAVQPVTWLHQYLLEKKGIRARMEATLYFPEMLKTTDQETLQAHTHAFLLELNATYDEEIELPPLKIGRYMVERKPVFSLIKLVNAVDEHNRVYSYDEVHDIEAMCWQLSNWGPIATYLERLRPNIEARQYWPFIGYAQGCRVIVVPVEELKELFTIRQQQRHFQYWVQQPQPEATKERMKQAARSWLEKHQMTPQAIRRLVISVLPHHDYETEVRAIRSLKLAPLKQALKQYRQKAIPRWREQFAMAVDEIDEKLDTDLIADLTELLKPPENRLSGVRYFLETDADQGIAGLSAYLTPLIQMGERNRKQAQAEQERHLSKMARPPFLLTRLFYRLFPHKLKNKLVKDYLFALALDRHLLHLEAQATLIERHQQRVQEHGQNLAYLEMGLRQAIQQLTEYEQRYSQQRQHRPIYEENVMTPAEEEAEYTKRIDQALQAAAHGLNITWQDGRWLLQGQDHDQTHLFNDQDLIGLQRFRDDFLKPFWRDLDALDIETILKRRNEDPTQLIERLKQKSSPLIAIDQVAYKEQQRQRSISLRREYILATPHGQERFFQDYTSADGFKIVSTGQVGKHWLACLHNLFHVSLLALKQSTAYRAAYLRQKASGRDLHIFAEDELGLDKQEDS